jgi:hypothetical protein
MTPKVSGPAPTVPDFSLDLKLIGGKTVKEYTTSIPEDLSL